MQIVILTGGKGTRLKPLTDSLPKPMIPVCGKPFLEYLVDYARAQGFSKILFLVGYRAQAIVDHFKNGRKFGVTIDYSYEKNLMGTAGALRRAGDKLDKEFILLNGDTFVPLEYKEITGKFRSGNKIGTVLLCRSRNAGKAGNIKIGRGGNITAVNCRVAPFIHAGVAVYKKTLLNYIPVDKFCDMETAVYPGLIKDKQLDAVIFKKRFYDMGTFEGIEKLGTFLEDEFLR